MIIGVGTDIIEISRIKRASEKKGFLKKVFTQNEIDIFKDGKFNSIAGNFAVKEAVSKAFGTGISGFNMTDIEVLRDEKGKPFVVLRDGAEVIAKNLGIEKIHVSISHNMENAIAYVIAEG